VSAPDLSAAAARRIALAAQGFTDRAPRGNVTVEHVRRVLGRVGLFQIDSVNVLVRAHYLPLFARLGPYAPSLLESLAYERRELFEYWGHEASLMPVTYEPLLRWRMDRASQGEAWGGLVTFARENRAYVEAAYQAVVDRGPLSAAGLGKRTAPAGPWWGWDERKHALEWLYWTGQIAIASRPNFERVYDLPVRIYPP
jgi:uncharacterized protein